MPEDKFMASRQIDLSFMNRRATWSMTSDNATLTAMKSRSGRVNHNERRNRTGNRGYVDEAF